ncbi:MAG: VCBS repeat-containing protein [Sulfitobacter sp.]
MRSGALRLLSRLHQPVMRSARVALCLGIGALPATAQHIANARYVDPTLRYAHGILGDGIEHGTLQLTLSDGQKLRIVLPVDRVFEDTSPRLADLDGDGKPEVIAVESSQTKGARLSIYSAQGLVASTPHIGRRNRWLAPIGAADLDGDGKIEIAYIDRPHLNKTLRIWRYDNRKLLEVGSLAGLTNHRIGERDIAGGIRNCSGTPEMIVATPDWTRLVAVTFRNGTLNARDIGPHQDRSSFRSALTCP